MTHSRSVLVYEVKKSDENMAHKRISAVLVEAEVEPIRIRVLPDGRMDRENAAKYLGRKPKTLAMWQLEGRGPKSILVGGRRYYYRETLDAFIRGDTA